MVKAINEKDETYFLQDECLLFWKDEDFYTEFPKIKHAFVKIVKISNGLLTFLTANNRFTIPTDAIVKIKESRRLRDADEN